MIDLAPSIAADVDARVAAFENEWHSAGQADPSVFLPEPDAPHYRQVLCELLRCDLELHWSSGRPSSLEDYRDAYPTLSDDPRQFAELAFEEYRQKVRAGLDAHPQQYAEKYGIDVSKWPTPDELLNPTVRTGIAESLPHHEFDDEVL